jgi:hypothetical protein
MAEMKKELLVSLSDIESICIECCSCHSQIRITPQATLKLNFQKPAPLIGCPACEVEFGEVLKQRVIALRSALEALAGTRPSISLQINASAFSA